MAPYVVRVLLLSVGVTALIEFALRCRLGEGIATARFGSEQVPQWRAAGRRQATAFSQSGEPRAGAGAALPSLMGIQSERRLRRLDAAN
jgi:hypothetical protein